MRSAALLLLLPLISECRAEAVRLCSAQIDVAIDRENGRVLEVENRLTGRRDPVRDARTVLAFAGFDLDLVNVAFHPAGEFRFRAETNGIEVLLAYRAQPDHAWVDRELTIVNRGREPVVLKRVSDGRLRFEQQFESVLYHDDNLGFDPAGDGNHEVDGTYRTALNVFLREPRGGLFAGLKYPYWTPLMTLDALSFEYEVNYRIRPGETLELPVLFLGAYRKTGYTCRKELHWRPRLVTPDEHAMDWGEVRAMQAVLKDYLPLYPAPAPGYFLWLNSWWAVLGTPEENEMQGQITPQLVPAWSRLLDQVRMSGGVVDALNTAPVWVGLANYIGSPETLASIGEDAKFPMNSSIRAVLDHAKAVHVPLLGFADPNGRVYREDRPDWRVQPAMDSQDLLRTRCHANPAYENWFYRLTRDTIDATGIVGWAWDYHWMRRPALCFHPGHGHEPGNTEFQQYRNVTRTVQQLRKDYPALFLEIYWGLKEGGSWAHRGLNSLENIYENGNVAPPGMSRADDQRFQVWFNQNYRFLPSYMNLAQINFEKNETNGFTYSILSALQASHHGQLNEWPQFHNEREAGEVFRDLKYWKQWAGDHLEYLNDRVTLFGMPCRKDGIDGSAHMLGDRGYIFVFNPWQDKEMWGSVPMDAMIGLERGERFAIDEISTKTPQRKAVVHRGNAFVFRIPARTALLFAVQPSEDALYEPDAPRGVRIQPAFVR